MDPLDLGLVVSATRNNTRTILVDTVVCLIAVTEQKLKAITSKQNLRLPLPWFDDCYFLCLNEHRWSRPNVPQSPYMVGFAFKVLDACAVAAWPESTV